MASVNITCGYPLHPQNSAQAGWDDGVLAVASQPQVLWCTGCAAYAAANPPAVVTTQMTLQQKAQNALTANATYLGIGSPTNAQVVAQVQALTRECSALIRLLLNQFDSTSGT